MEVKSFPNISEYDYTAKAVGFQIVNVIERDAAESHHFRVDDTVRGGILKLQFTERRLEVGFRNAVVDLTQKHIVAFGFSANDFFHAEARATHMTAVFGRRFRITLA